MRAFGMPCPPDLRQRDKCDLRMPRRGENTRLPSKGLMASGKVAVRRVKPVGTTDLLAPFLSAPDPEGWKVLSFRTIEDNFKADKITMTKRQFIILAIDDDPND